jgi:CDP-glucose 4,6-dehydratase
MHSEHFGDVADAQFVDSVFKSSKFDWVLHMAAQPLVFSGYSNPEETFRTNVLGTINVLSSAANQATPRVLVITTDKVYKKSLSTQSFSEDSELGGSDPYSASKASADLISRAFGESLRLRNLSPLVAVARGGNVLGGGDLGEGRLIPDIELAIETGESLSLRNPNYTRPWQYVLDCLNGYLAILDLSDSLFRGAWNVGPNAASDGVSVKKIVENYFSIRGSADVEEAGPSEFPESPHLMIDSGKLITDSSWKPKLTTLQMLRETADWNTSVKVDHRDAKEVTQEAVSRFLRW